MIKMPISRTVGISYAKLLLDDTSLKEHKFRKKQVVSAECDCKMGTEDVEHFILCCSRYAIQRQHLTDTIGKLWMDDVKKAGNLSMTKQLLLSPVRNAILNEEQHQQVKKAFFLFLAECGRDI